MKTFYRLLRLSAVIFWWVLFGVIIGAIIDIAKNGNSGYPDLWRSVRRPYGFLAVFVLLVNGTILATARQLTRRSCSAGAVLILLWVIVEPLWPRI